MSDELVAVSPDWAKRAYVDDAKYKAMYEASTQDPVKVWGEHGKRVDWIKPYSPAAVRDVDYTGQVRIRWFHDGVLNVSANCIDRHLARKADQVAIIWEGDDPAHSKKITYRELHGEVSRMANALKELGVRKGDRVTIYLPMIPEAAYAMLACARIGAVHSVVFGGFSPDSLANRIVDCESTVVITADEGLRGGKPVPLKVNTDEAIKKAPGVKKVLAQGRAAHDGRLSRLRVDDAPVRLRLSRRRHLLVHRRRGLGDRSQLHPLRTARQRRDHVDVRGRAQLSRLEPLLAGHRQAPGQHFLYRAHRHPRADARGRGAGEERLPQEPAPAGVGRRADQSRGLALVLQGGGRQPLPHRRHLVADRDRRHPDHAASGRHRAQARLGNQSVLRREVYGDHQRFIDTYFKTYPGMYFTGDGARRDEDGYYWITGRVDDVINVSGHRIGTAEVESALVGNTRVAEAAVVGYPHDIKGQGIYAYVTLKTGQTPTEELRKDLNNWVRKEIGPIATPDVIQWAPGLPKTRSGKIMRRILRKIAENDFSNLGDTSTLADPAVVDDLVKNRAK